MAGVTAAIVAGAAVSAAGGIAAASMGKPDSPEARNYAQETRDTLQAQIDLAPQQFAVEQEYRPRYNALEFDEQMAFLLGRPGGMREQEYVEMVRQKVDGTGEYKWHPGARTGNYVEEQYETVPVTRKRMVEVPGQRGFLDMLDKDISPILRDIQSDDRAAEIADVAKLGPEAMAAQRAANPAAAAIVDELLAEAGANARGELGAGERRDIQQSIREAQVSRGVGYGPSDVWGEVYGSGIASRELAFNKGARALGASDAFYGQPFERVLGRASSAGAGPGLMAMAGAGSTGGPQLFNPESPYAADLYNTNFNASSAAAISARNNRASLLGSLIGAGGGIAGAGIKASAYNGLWA